jgi:hypothetical protein
MWLGVAMAQDRELPGYETLTLVGVAHGDFDGSGDLDQAVMYVRDGESVVEIAFGVPERSLLDPVSPSDRTLGLEVLDADEDQIDDLLFTTEGEPFLLPSADRSWLPEGALDGVGDLVPDVTVVYSVNEGNTSTTLGGFGTVKPCGMYCLSRVYVTFPCGTGMTCTTRFCTSWLTICY